MIDNFALVILLFGCFFFVLATGFRFSFQPDYKNNILKSIIKSLLPVDIRKKNIQSFNFLFQLPGLFMLFGKAYSDIVTAYRVTDLQRNLLNILIGVGPPVIFWGLLTFLRHNYWEKQQNNQNNTDQKSNKH